MGRMMGSFDSDELDRPDLNKCPDCGCFFATEACPLCGKICPEDMRAGNRAKVKPPKKRQSSSGRVQFVAWYYSWWFILIMMYVMPLAGLILFFTSPHSKKSKLIAAAAVVGAYVVLFVLGTGLLRGLLERPLVNDDISRAEYVSLCETVSVEDYHRDAYNEGRYVVLELTVELPMKADGDIYYLCSGLDGGDVKILLLDCGVEKKTNYIQGDKIRVYGECSGTTRAGFSSGELPLLYMAYSELME